MDPFKKTRFENLHPGIVLPEVTPVSDSEMREIRIRLAKEVGFPAEVDNLALTHHVASLLQPLSGVSADDAEFDLLRALKMIGVEPAESVYINWYRYDRIDRIKIADLSKFLRDFWYAAADDIEIFDNSLGWLMAIDHSGNLSYARWEGNRTETD